MKTKNLLSWCIDIDNHTKTARYHDHVFVIHSNSPNHLLAIHTSERVLVRAKRFAYLADAIETAEVYAANLG